MQFWSYGKDFKGIPEHICLEDKGEIDGHTNA